MSPSSSGRFDAVLFDLFGTLIPTGSRGARARNLERVASVLGVEASAFAERWFGSFDARIRGTLGSLEETVQRLCRSLGRSPTDQQIQRAAQLRLAFTDRILARGVRSVPALRRLRRAGIRLALVSNTSEETVRLWPASPLSPWMDTTVFSCTEGLRKPDAAIYRLALRRLGLSAARCAFVGDGGDRELSGAGAVGLTPFLYRFPWERRATAFRVDEEADWSGAVLEELDDLLRVGPSVPPRPPRTPPRAGSPATTSPRVPR
jgi:putative hydrolase of the HAD superfamily